jgi:hypothetical protein
MHQKFKLKNFNDVRALLNQLEQGPVETTGLWSYFQILTHCATAMENSMLGRRREMSWWKRHVRGPLFFRKISRDGFLPSGIKGNPQIAFDERIEGDEKAALTKLLKTMEDFEKFEGNLSDHILLGNLTKKQWILFHSMHLANHLGHAQLKATNEKP